MMATNTLCCLVRNLHFLTVGLRSEGYVYNVLSSCSRRGYAKKVAVKKGKGMVKEVLKGPEVCKDAARLTTYAVGVNVFKQGEDPQLKPREEYPDWLFQVNLGPPKKLSELDPESRDYWKVLRKEHMWRYNRLHKGRKL